MNGCSLLKEPSSKLYHFGKTYCGIVCALYFSYSSADIAVVCKEALLGPIRRLASATHFKRVRYFGLFLIDQC
jgi:hypothetical protein